MKRDAIINWFEIPVRDIARAQSFYESLLQTKLRREPMGESVLAVFPHDDDAQSTGGCLIARPGSAPPADAGTIVYLNAAPSLDALLDRVGAAGGRIATPKVTLPDGIGCFAHVVDSEGNKVGFHALA